MVINKKNEMEFDSWLSINSQISLIPLPFTVAWQQLTAVNVSCRSCLKTNSYKNAWNEKLTITKWPEKKWSDTKKQ